MLVCTIDCMQGMLLTILLNTLYAELITGCATGNKANSDHAERDRWSSQTMNLKQGSLATLYCGVEGNP